MISDPPIQLVWFKKDLRIRDHAPLYEACKQGPVWAVYVYEPEIINAPDFDPSHLVFINQSLTELEKELKQIGIPLTTIQGNLPKAFNQLLTIAPIHTLWSHEETGNQLTYQRDIRVGQWADEQGIIWNEHPQTGVIRRLKERKHWAGRWENRMTSSLVPIPESSQAGPRISSVGILSELDCGLTVSTKTQAQPGGENQAWETLHSFLVERGEFYQKDMSSPGKGWDSCSRISPYLTFGNLSMKQVVYTSRKQINQLKEQKASGEQIGFWLRSLRSFDKRLHWHCHFMQKLEDEPDIEYENFCRTFDGLRESEFNPAYFEAWKRGETGYPLVDACMRCLHQTGWINFRMRAMLVSFASYHLWLDWRPTSQYLATQFLDYEPGIHYSQFQMQSGTTGINSIRIYSPIKQVFDNDPEGEFIKQWVPELENIPNEYLAEPHTLPPLMQTLQGIHIGTDYPAPLVDHKTVYKAARDRVYAVKRMTQTREAAALVFEKHGSRWNQNRNNSPTKKKNSSST
jgi:deoxyribodipyrimidine photo-lyase